VSLTTASPLSQTGLIPRIYRRADFSHRATPESLPLSDSPVRKASGNRGVTVTSYTWSSG
jgi:hypothetical protein